MTNIEIGLGQSPALLAAQSTNKQYLSIIPFMCKIKTCLF